MSDVKYKAFKALPIGSDFDHVSAEGYDFPLDDIRAGKDEPLGRLSSAAYVRVQEAELVQQTLDTLLQGNKITPDMAEHIRALPLEHVFCAHQSLIFATARHVRGESPNAFIQTGSFNEILEDFGLPGMDARL